MAITSPSTSSSDSIGSFEEIYDRFHHYVHGVAQRVSSSASSADEIAQEVFISVWKHPEHFNPERGTLQAYLGTLTHHRAVDHLRRDASRSARENRAAANSPTSMGDLQDEVLARDTSGRVRAAVEKLPIPQREVVELAYLGGYSYQTTAQRLGIPEGTATSRGRMALKRLGESLTNDLADSLPQAV
jgi:RNA polymerase sigma factor (sigma-70 family)